MAASRRAIEAGDAFVTISALDRTATVLSSIESRMASFGRTMTTLGRNLNILGIVTSVGIGVVERQFATFDDTMRAVKSVISGITNDEYSMLVEKAKELGRTTSFTARQVAESMLVLGRAGLDASAIDESIASVLSLSRATGTELPRATEIAIDILRAFKMPTAESARVMDILTSAANGSSQTLEDLFEALKLVGPLAVQTGDSIEEAAAQVAVLANAGIKASLAGTALRRGFVNLSSPEIQEKLRELTGVEAVDANKNLRPLINIMTDIGAAIKQLPSAERLGIFEEIFGIRGLVAATNLADAKNEFDRLLEVIATSGGVANTMAQEMDSGIGGTIRRLLSASEGLSIQLGESLAPAFMAVGEAITVGIRDLQLFLYANEEMALLAPAVAGGLLAAGTSLWVFGKAVKYTGLVIGAVSFGMQALAANVRAADRIFKISIITQHLYHKSLLLTRWGLMRAGNAFIGFNSAMRVALRGLSALDHAIESVSVMFIRLGSTLVAAIRSMTAATTTLRLTTTSLMVSGGAAKVVQGALIGMNGQLIATGTAARAVEKGLTLYKFGTWRVVEAASVMKNITQGQTRALIGYKGALTTTRAATDAASRGLTVYRFASSRVVDSVKNLGGLLKFQARALIGYTGALTTQKAAATSTTRALTIYQFATSRVAGAVKAVSGLLTYKTFALIKYRGAMIASTAATQASAGALIVYQFAQSRIVQPMAAATMLLAAKTVATIRDTAATVASAIATRTVAVATSLYQATLARLLAAMAAMRAALTIQNILTFAVVGATASAVITLTLFRGAVYTAVGAIRALTTASTMAALTTKLLSGMLALIPIALTLLTNPITFIAAAIVGLAVAWDEWGASLKRTSGIIAGSVGAAFARFREMIKGIYDALSSGNLGLAAQIAGVGLKRAFLAMLDHMAKNWNTTVDAMIKKIVAWAAAVYKAGVKVKQFFAAPGEWVGNKAAELLGLQTAQQTAFLQRQAAQERAEELKGIENYIKGVGGMELPFFDLEQTDKDMDKLLAKAKALKTAQDLEAQGMRVVTTAMGPMVVPITAADVDTTRLSELQDKLNEPAPPSQAVDPEHFSTGTFSAEVAKNFNFAEQFMERTADATEGLLEEVRNQRNSWINADSGISIV